MSDIFISYASEDKGRVQALARALEQKGWSVWWDRRIPIGRSFDEVIEEALDGSKAVVVVWTQTAVKSQWVKNEAREGLRRRVLFPVMLVEEVRIPLEFRDVQTAHLMDWQPEQEHAGFEQFLDDLIGVIGAPMVKSQAPPASSIKQTPEPETGLLQGPVRAVLISGDNNLSGLTPSMGTLEPAFAASTTDYTVNVASDVSNINISAAKANLDAVLSGVVTVGSGVTTGQATIQLNGPGTVTPAAFTVTAPNGNSKTYRIMVNRAALSGNNNLSALTISPGSLSPAFNASTLNYAVDVASTVTSMTVTPKPQHASADMTVNGQVTKSGQARTIALNGPGSTTLLTIVVTAPNGIQKTYTVNISRAALSGNNNLKSLALSPGMASSSFSASRSTYAVNVDSSVTSVTVTPTLQDDTSSLTINGQGTHAGQGHVISLGPTGSNTEVEIGVIAQNGGEKTYRITVSRAALPEDAEVEQEPERHEQQSPTAVPGAMSRDSSVAAPLLTDATEQAEVDSEFASAGEDRSNESTGARQSAESLPYLPLGLGIFAAMGALVYFLISSQSPSFGPREVTQYQPSVQSPTTRGEVITPPPVPEPKQPAIAPTKTKSPVKREEKSDETVAAKPRTATGSVKTITGKDGAPMVLVPAGEFMMGTRDVGESAEGDERPAHPVYLDAYLFDQYEVTISLYSHYLQETNRTEPGFWSEQALKSHGRKPVVAVDWNDAIAYCTWAGKRLPSEAEWEKAARGIDQRLYPWGNETPNEQRANFNHCCGFSIEMLTNVGTYERGQSPYGAYDMAGNALEWTADWYDEYYYHSSKSSSPNPTGPLNGRLRVLRGGSYTDELAGVRSANRFELQPTVRHGNVGFRCAKDATK